MKTASRNSILAVAAVLFLAAAFALNTIQNVSHEDYRDSNFAKFWIAGRMVFERLNPYDPAQWTEQHHLLGAASVPDHIFLYPLPQAFFLVPLALVPPAASFLAWSLLSQVILAVTVYALFRLAGISPPWRLFLPLMVLLLFFGPMYLGLQIGSIGIIALAALVGSLVLLGRRQSMLAGVILSLLILKPSQGLPLLVLIGLWFLFQRNLRAIVGMLAGGLLLLVSGLLYDPNWIPKFLSNSGVVSARTLGLQSNVLGFASLACGHHQPCTWLLGGVGILGILELGGFLLWRHRSRWTDWEALNIIILLGYLAAVYSWSYDQLLYVIPILWIASRLQGPPRGYWLALAFLLALDIVAFVALGVQAYTGQDLLSVLTTLLVLGFFIGLQKQRGSFALSRAPAPRAGPQEP